METCWVGSPSTLAKKKCSTNTDICLSTQKEGVTSFACNTTAEVTTIFGNDFANTEISCKTDKNVTYCRCTRENCLPGIMS